MQPLKAPHEKKQQKKSPLKNTMKTEQQKQTIKSLLASVDEKYLPMLQKQAEELGVSIEDAFCCVLESALDMIESGELILPNNNA